MEKLINKFGIAIATIFAFAGVVYAQSTFLAPTQAPPGGNTEAPLNVGASNQVKNGALGLNSLAVFNNAVVRGSLDVAGGYSAGGVPGITRTCTSGAVLVNQIIAGGILTGGNCGAGGGGGDGGIPAGMIAMFDAACPSGWTRFASLDGLFPLGGATFGARGGSANIDSIKTTITVWPQGTSADNRGPNPRTGDHWHAVEAPPYVTVVWCKKN